MMKPKKIVKPIDVDAHFKYRCPKCNIEHWVSLKEAKTKNFKVVCDCSKVFSPKRISKIKIMYATSAKPRKSTQHSYSPKINDEKSIFVDPDKQEHNKEIVFDINKELLEKCQSILIGYGFTHSEANNLIKQTYYTNPSDDAMTLVKSALKSLGESSI